MQHPVIDMAPTFLPLEPNENVQTLEPGDLGPTEDMLLDIGNDPDAEPYTALSKGTPI